MEDEFAVPGQENADRGAAGIEAGARHQATAPAVVCLGGQADFGDDFEIAPGFLMEIGKGIGPVGAEADAVGQQRHGIAVGEGFRMAVRPDTGQTPGGERADFALTIGHEGVFREIGLEQVLDAVAVCIFRMWIGAQRELLPVRQPIAIGVGLGVIAEGLEAILMLPTIVHAVAIRVCEQEVGADSAFGGIFEAVAIEVHAEGFGVGKGDVIEQRRWSGWLLRPWLWIEGL